MDKTVGVLKHGWHPQKKEGRSIRGEVSGLVGRGKKDASSSANARSPSHAARPLASLKDPDAFGPPPKNINYHTTESNGAGAASRRQPQTRQPEEGWKAAGPVVPYRSNTTGLSTAGLLPPPRPTETVRDIDAMPNTKPKPQLPPRLPPRRDSQPAIPTSSPPPAYTESSNQYATNNAVENQGAVNRLAKSGISVPGFGIGRPTGTSTSPSSDDPQSQAHSTQKFSSPSISGLRTQFSGLSTSTSTQPTQTTNAPSTGTTWAQKQAALSTASQFQRDPSKVNTEDARAAFSTANNFRQRHGDEVAKGWSVGQEMNKKYGVVNKAQEFAGTAGQAPGGQSGQPGASQTATGLPASGAAFKKAPPPPPPTRKPTNPIAASRSPPPIPMSSKPR